MPLFIGCFHLFFHKFSNIAYENNLQLLWKKFNYFVFCYKNNLYISAYHDKCLYYKLQMSLSKWVPIYSSLLTINKTQFNELIFVKFSGCNSSDWLFLQQFRFVINLLTSNSKTLIKKKIFYQRIKQGFWIWHSKYYVSDAKRKTFDSGSGLLDLSILQLPRV